MSTHLHKSLPVKVVGVMGLALALLAPAATALDLPTLRSEQPPIYTADVAVSVDPQGLPGLSVTISLAYPDLTWIKVGDGFAARFEVVVRFEPSNGKVQKEQYGDAWQRQVRVATFNETTAYSSTVMEHRTFRLPSGKYKMRVHVHDLNSDLESVVSESFTAPDYSKVPLALSDMELGVVGLDGKFEIVPARTYGYDSSRLAARVGIVDRRDGDWPRTYSLHYRILDSGGQELARGDRDVSIPKAAEPAIVRPDSAAWFVGNYTFSLQLVDGKSKWQTERAFEVEQSGPPRGAEFKRMLEPLAYITEPSELDELAHASEADQAAAWDRFWKRRDPTPDTPRNEALIEFLRRVRYADQHFQHFGPGWRSDMGRIYIKYGAPDQVETRPATVQSPPVEVWYYNRPYRQFVFADREGFGRYVLVSPGAD